MGQEGVRAEGSEVDAEALGVSAEAPCILSTRLVSWLAAFRDESW